MSDNTTNQPSELDQATETPESLTEPPAQDVVEAETAKPATKQSSVARSAGIVSLACWD